MRRAVVCVLATAWVGACGIHGPVDTTSTTGGGHGAQGPASSTDYAASSAVVATNGASGGGLVPNVPPSFTVEGRVVDQDGHPLAGATVLQGGHSTEPTMASGDDGTFTLAMTYDGLGTPTVVASKLGYRSNGVELLEVPDAPLELTLVAATPPDNIAYPYGSPGKGKDPSTLFCGHCHDTLAAEFQTSKHAAAARDPLVQDLYAGAASGLTTEAACITAGGVWRAGHLPGTAADVAARCYVGSGVLPDLNPVCKSGSLACDDPNRAPADRPTQFGGCADCHAPGMNGKAGGRDLLEATDVGYEDGVHCDFCHKVADVALDEPPGVGGRLRVQRPHETFKNGPPGSKLIPVMFGPLLDVPNPLMGGSLQPKFSSAVFCAGCHEDHQPALVPGTTLAARFKDGLPVHTTYSEWLEGPYSGGGVPCQHCHMPANDELDAATDLGHPNNASITFGFPRPPEQIRRHIFRSPLVRLSPAGLRLIDTALTSGITAKVVGNTVEVDVAVGNVGCGHAVPTGDPMRAVVMRIEGTCNGTALAATGGDTLDDTAGARAEGVVGAEVHVSGSTVDWPEAAAHVVIGDVVRIVRPTATFRDYDGVGLFAGAALPASEKGLPLREPVGAATVLGVTGSSVTLDASLTAMAGDLVYLGDAFTELDGSPSRALAGAPGRTYARVLVDSKGLRQAPHYRAVDVARDNRIAPTKVQHSSHRFALPAGCTKTSAELRVTLWYRPLPLVEARSRGWNALDFRIGGSVHAVAVP